MVEIVSLDPGKKSFKVFTIHGHGSNLGHVTSIMLSIFLFPRTLKLTYLLVFGVGVSCRKLYYFVVYLYVNGSGSITSVGEDRANLSAVIYL